MIIGMAAVTGYTILLIQAIGDEGRVKEVETIPSSGVAAI
jgi:hypothetical protein